MTDEHNNPNHSGNASDSQGQDIDVLANVAHGAFVTDRHVDNNMTDMSVNHIHGGMDSGTVHAVGNNITVPHNSGITPTSPQSGDVKAPPESRKVETSRGGVRWKAGDKILGRYEVIEFLGQGGMGVVYRCLDLVGKVEVAVKSLPPEVSHNPAEMEDVRDNYTLVTRLSHQNIANYKTLERDENTGDYYLVMDYVEGDNLRGWMRKKWREQTLTLETALPVLRQVAEALDAAHCQGIIHRDVKPDNVKIQADGTVKVLDFGLAAQVRSSMARLSSETVARAGTNLYKSPEQWLASTRQGEAADQYSLAVTAYEMLSGHVPFESDDTSVLMKAVVERAPEPIESLPSYANTALMAGLSKKAEGRYASCVDFVRALGGEKVATSKKTGNPVWITVSVVAAVVVLVTMGLAYSILNHNGSNSDESELTIIETDRESKNRQLRDLENKAHKLAEKGGYGEWVEVNELADQMAAVDATVAAGWRSKAEYFLKKPRVELKAFINGREVNATLSGSMEKTPMKRDLVAGTPLAGRLFYQENGEEYEASFNEVVNWTGLKTQNVELKQIILPASVSLPDDVSLEMVRIKAGNFWMGSPDDEPGRSQSERRHRVTLTRNYCLGKYEVTQGQWKAVMGTKLIDQAEKVHPGEGLRWIGNLGDDYPMYWVNWDEAMEFCHRLTERERSAGRLPVGYEYSLPTEAQWEYACRAGTDAALYNGPIEILGENNAPALDGIAWYSGNSSIEYEGTGWDTKDWKEKQYPNGFAGPRRVGGRKANDYGLYDMLGNVQEWCRDCDIVYPGGSVTDPVGSVDHSRRIIRGGSWCDYARWCRSSQRICDNPLSRTVSLGFRVALVPVDLTTFCKYGDIKTSLDGKVKTVALPNGMELKMIKIEAGNFIMGSEDEDCDDNEKPIHKVEITKDYWLGQYEVTQGQYAAVMHGVKKENGEFYNTRPMTFEDGDQLPVGCVSWYDARIFCKKMNEIFEGKLPEGYCFELPTEAQWEYAARGGRYSKGYKYSGSNTLTDVGWYSVNSGKRRLDDDKPDMAKLELNNCKPHQVGTKEKNELGLYDMSGNIDEWCLDWFDKYPSNMLMDPVGPASGSFRVIKGGCWLTTAKCCHSTRRLGLDPIFTGSVGFRIALVPIPNDMTISKSVTEKLFMPSGNELLKILNASTATQITEPMIKTKEFGAPDDTILIIHNSKGIFSNNKQSDLKYGGCVFEFETEEDFYAEIWLNVVWGGPNSNTIDIRVDDEKKSVTIGNDSIYNAWHWMKSPKSYKLYAGKHKLYILNHEEGVKFAQVFITNDKDLVPQGFEKEIAKDKVTREKNNEEKKIINDKMMITLPGGGELKLVRIEPGSFINTDINKKITLTHEYWLGETEVTQEQYYAVMKDGVMNEKGKQCNSRPSRFKDDDRLPVECVIWDDAMAFCKELTRRERSAGRLPEGYEYSLPTEAQWEFAARGGRRSKGYKYSGAVQLHDVGWYRGNSGNKTHPVGQKDANELGLYDMSGNVSEWCRDWFHGEWSHDPETLAGMKDDSDRVNRGGCWSSDAWFCRSSYREGFNSLFCSSSIGFRVALVPVNSTGSAASSDNVNNAEDETKTADDKAIVKTSNETAEEKTVAKTTNEKIEYKTITLPCGVELKLVKIPPGSFIMGSSPKDDLGQDSDEKQHRVILTKGYWIGETEVTQGQYAAIMVGFLKLFKGTTYRPSSFKGDDSLPVECVSWNDAMSFCKKLSERERAAGRLPAGYEYSLPTEAQWEYACRAGTTTPWHFGDNLSSDQANFNGNYPGVTTVKGKYLAKTTPVKSYKPNAWGLYDMHGNVWEWCHDWYGSYSDGEVTDPQGPSIGSSRITRGGSWFDYVRNCRSSFRDRYNPSYRYNNIGFRIALVPVP